VYVEAKLNPSCPKLWESTLTDWQLMPHTLWGVGIPPATAGNNLSKPPASFAVSVYRGRQITID